MVTFGEQMWEQAMIRESNGTCIHGVLMYSYFNGVYVADGTKQNGRPRFVEQNKLDGSRYESTKGAEFNYCSKLNAWVFRHERIRKSWILMR